MRRAALRNTTTVRGVQAACVGLNVAACGSRREVWLSEVTQDKRGTPGELSSMATPAGSNVWAERAAARQREATVSGGSTNSLNGGSLSQNGKGSGLVGKAVAPEDPGAVTEDRVEVLQESVGFIMGPKVRPIPPDQPELHGVQAVVASALPTARRLGRVPLPAQRCQRACG